MLKNDRDRPEPRAIDSRPDTICDKQGTLYPCLYLRVQDFDAIVETSRKRSYGRVLEISTACAILTVIDMYVIMLDNVVDKC